MEILHPVCCGLDVHQKTVVAALRRVQQGTVAYERRTFGTTVADLRQLADWLQEAACPIAAMESTGIYWKPVYHILVQHLELVISNPQMTKPRPGNKTDPKDAAWLADLLAHGLIEPSFIPAPEIMALRELTRLRVKLVQQRTAAKNRIHKLLESSNLKVTSVLSDLFGVTGRRILDLLAKGERSPEVLAQQARGTLRKKIQELEAALEGSFTSQHACLLKLHLDQIDLFQQQIQVVDEQLNLLCQAYEPELDQLDSIPGIDQVAARTVLAEIGPDMTVFGSDKRLARWAKLCPGNNESAGKRRPGKTGKGSRWLSRILVQAAWAARRTESFLGKTFRRLEVRLGGKKAAVAVAHKILRIIYHLFAEGTFYDEQRYAQDYARAEQKRLQRALKLVQHAGYEVSGHQTA